MSIGAIGCSVQFYDGVQVCRLCSPSAGVCQSFVFFPQGHLLRHEVYGVSPSNHAAIVGYIHQQEQSWLGKAVVARRDSDGVYYPGEG